MDVDDASSMDEEDLNGAHVTLSVSKSRGHENFQYRDDLESRISKKLNSIEQFHILHCKDKFLSYEASEYLGEVIK